MMLSEEQLVTTFGKSYTFSKSPYTDRREVEAMRAVERAAVLALADDMDFWNSIHDSNNQADSDWIRQRYGVNE